MRSRSRSIAPGPAVRFRPSSEYTDAAGRERTFASIRVRNIRCKRPMIRALVEK